MKQPKQASTSSLRLDRRRQCIEQKGTLPASGAFRPIRERASRSAVHHEQVAAAHLLPPHQSTLSLLRRLWPRQLIRSSIRSSPEAVVHLTGSCSSLALLILLGGSPWTVAPQSSALLVSMLTCSCPALQNWYLSLLACREYYVTLDTPNVWCCVL
jgi:hypothetical protein